VTALKRAPSGNDVLVVPRRPPPPWRTPLRHRTALAAHAPRAWGVRALQRATAASQSISASAGCTTAGIGVMTGGWGMAADEVGGDAAAAAGVARRRGQGAGGAVNRGRAPSSPRRGAVTGSACQCHGSSCGAAARGGPEPRERWSKERHGRRHHGDGALERLDQEKQECRGLGSCSAPRPSRSRRPRLWPVQTAAMRRPPRRRRRGKIGGRVKVRELLSEGAFAPSETPTPSTGKPAHAKSMI